MFLSVFPQNGEPRDYEYETFCISCMPGQTGFFGAISSEKRVSKKITIKLVYFQLDRTPTIRDTFFPTTSTPVHSGWGCGHWGGFFLISVTPRGGGSAESTHPPQRWTPRFCLGRRLAEICVSFLGWIFYPHFWGPPGTLPPGVRVGGGYPDPHRVL